jgi:hypothetical protein
MRLGNLFINGICAICNKTQNIVVLRKKESICIALECGLGRMELTKCDSALRRGSKRTRD